MINILPRINKTGKRPLMIRDAEECRKVKKMKERLRTLTEMTETILYNRSKNHLNNSGILTNSKQAVSDDTACFFCVPFLLYPL